MYETLLLERDILETGLRDALRDFARERDKEKALEKLSIVLAMEKRIESINCKLVHMKFMEMFKKAEES